MYTNTDVHILVTCTNSPTIPSPWFLGILLAFILSPAATGQDPAAAVVRIVSSQGAGSGTLIAQTEQPPYILTAAHVVQDSATITALWADGHRSPARLLAADEHLDRALLEVTPPRGAATIELAAENQWPTRGDTVELIGYGGGQLRHWQATVKGYALTRGLNKYQTLSVATATIGGDSGGAILFRNRLVGVIWGGPLAGPRGPMLATHGSCSIAIGAFVEKVLGRRPSVPICTGPNCPLPANFSPPIRQPPASAECSRCAEELRQLQARIAALERSKPPELNTDLIVRELLRQMADDRRFRGPPGQDGRDGQDATADVARLAEQVKQRLAGSIRIRVEPATAR